MKVPESGHVADIRVKHARSLVMNTVQYINESYDHGLDLKTYNSGGIWLGGKEQNSQ